jgi:hypothetical protein
MIIVDVPSRVNLDHHNFRERIGDTRLLPDPGDFLFGPGDILGAILRLIRPDDPIVYQAVCLSIS